MENSLKKEHFTNIKLPALIILCLFLIPLIIHSLLLYQIIELGNSVKALDDEHLSNGQIEQKIKEYKSGISYQITTSVMTTIDMIITSPFLSIITFILAPIVIIFIAGILIGQLEYSSDIKYKLGGLILIEIVVFTIISYILLFTNIKIEYLILDIIKSVVALFCGILTAKVIK